MIKLRIQIQHLEQIVPVDLVQVAVGERADVATRLADGGVLARVLAEYVVFAWKKRDGVFS